MSENLVLLPNRILRKRFHVVIFFVIYYIKLAFANIQKLAISAGSPDGKLIFSRTWKKQGINKV